MAEASQDSISVIVLDANEQFRTLLAHHITTAWPAAKIEQLTTLRELDVAASPDCFILDHTTLQQAASAADATIWFHASAVIARRPCIVVAEPSDELLAVRYIKGGAKDYLPKRLIRHDLLISSICECLGRSSPVRPVEPEPEPDAQAPDTDPQAKSTDLEPVAEDSQGEDREVTSGQLAGTDEAHGPQDESAELSPEPTPVSPPVDKPRVPKPRVRRSSKRRSSRLAPRAGVHRGGPEIEGYSIQRPIAKGGIASVYLAHSEALGHEVALKVLRASKSTARNKLYERFRQEYRLVSKLDSDSVVKTYDFGHTDKEVYIAFEYFPGGDLKVRMREPVSVEQSVDYLKKIATALDELHRLGIYHRDLKPANVMLRKDDSIALIDFGTAKQLQSTETLTLPGTVQGTPHYLSPEQAKGETVDARSDIYSLGVLFFQMLEGRKPYTASNALEVSMAHIMDPVPELSADNAGYQPLINWMMAKNIDERCPNLGELLEILARKSDQLPPVPAAVLEEA